MNFLLEFYRRIEVSRTGRERERERERERSALDRLLCIHKLRRKEMMQKINTAGRNYSLSVLTIIFKICQVKLSSHNLN